MLEAAVNAIAPLSKRPLLVAITVLTSMDQEQLTELGLQQDMTTLVSKWATLAQQSGLDGVVCSGQEARLLRQSLPHFILVTPGIRLSPTIMDDQMRVMTPDTALANGANYLVIGRPITQSPNPHRVLTNLLLGKYHES
jgi:orotidine-5'-phosphate decarboxylase